MSIHPRYADAILAGTKRVEFRKRRLAPDVSTVVIYATQPVGRIVGTFEVLGHDVAPPPELWNRHRIHAGISVAGYDEYYAQTPAAVGILIGSVQQLSQPRPVTDLPGVSRPPQSFSYLTRAQAIDVQTWLQREPRDTDRTSSASGPPSVVASILVRTADAIHAAASLLRRAV
ncbi:ASCH domain-containing protein [Blastococcus sp. VKM Ac-2987]|uniref:ASCH domain-containing protein n=1 Tax=Blastococcus sp. VKM Ac-2987 TaxID=3004141 RepID=UPI0022AB70B4|nr:ASCH domain-containing protein [Blastococcus sp. VKM Ac-2987]MCZ2859181.1 ASCH domain-containing protein [Blastococcus sp. VKM Ac-2987]